MVRKSKIHRAVTFAVAATFAAINASVSLAVAANAEGSQQGSAGVDFVESQAARSAVDKVESYAPTHTESQYVSPFKPYDAATAVRPKAITLAAMPTHELAKKIVPANIGGPTIASVARVVADTDTAVKTASRMQWITSALGNKIGSIRIKSTDAKAVIIGVLVEQLPSEAKLRFHADKTSTAFHVSAAEILTRIQTNVDAGDNTDFGRTFWTPPLDSDDVTMEIELPSGINTDAVQISIPLISHFSTAAAELAVKALKQPITAAGPCNLDATCYPQYDTESRSVARILYMPSPGNGAYCTGNLVNNRLSDGTPYFLTGHHCIFTQTQASNIIQLEWLYRASACNSGVQSTPTYQTGGGAVLLHVEPQLDMTFLRLNEAPPSVARFAAWTAELVNVGEPALGLHNPNGRLQEASLGAVTGYLACNTPSPGATPSCNTATPATATHTVSRWTGGSVHFGSSGSGLFVTKNNSRYLVGQLHAATGDPNVCDLTFPKLHYYGRFDVAYRAALNRWLSPVELILRNGFE